MYIAEITPARIRDEWLPSTRSPSSAHRGLSVRQYFIAKEATSVARSDRWRWMFARAFCRPFLFALLLIPIRKARAGVDAGRERDPQHPGPVVECLCRVEVDNIQAALAQEKVRGANCSPVRCGCPVCGHHAGHSAAGLRGSTCHVFWAHHLQDMSARCTGRPDCSSRSHQRGWGVVHANRPSPRGSWGRKPLMRSGYYGMVSAWSRWG